MQGHAAGAAEAVGRVHSRRATGAAEARHALAADRGGVQRHREGPRGCCHGDAARPTLAITRVRAPRARAARGRRQLGVARAAQQRRDLKDRILRVVQAVEFARLAARHGPGAEGDGARGLIHLRVDGFVHRDRLDAHPREWLCGARRVGAAVGRARAPGRWHRRHDALRAHSGHAAVARQIAVPVQAVATAETHAARGAWQPVAWRQGPAGVALLDANDD
mmetsp:Transcript_22983/g.64562  ORF Transcript_22983/g.64562 Transcript_22983/m.64562 type:complete len:221 (-) Transcript_22983:239-901(-)